MLILNAFFIRVFEIFDFLFSLFRISICVFKNSINSVFPYPSFFPHIPKVNFDEFTAAGRDAGLAVLKGFAMGGVTPGGRTMFVEMGNSPMMGNGNLKRLS